jgi:hypothetical protein
MAKLTTVVTSCLLQPRVNKQGHAGPLTSVNSRYEGYKLAYIGFSCISRCDICLHYDP